MKDHFAESRKAHLKRSCGIVGRLNIPLALATGVLVALCQTIAPPHSIAAPRPEWIRPSGKAGAEPIWGLRDGLSVGLWPTSGPRGLFRIYTPYLGQPRLRMVNYVSVEPVVGRSRGQSELEVGAAGKPGLAMWSADTRDALKAGEAAPARGRIVRMGNTEALTVWVAMERFRNGAQPAIQLILRADRPHEVGFRIHASPESAPLTSCVLSATMGNYARLRRLWLNGEVVDARQLWPDFQPDRLGFAPWRSWPRERMFRQNRRLLVAATSDELDPARGEYAPAVPPHWRYTGKPATQYWRAADAPGAVVRVNGRRTYWGEQGPIPGGVSYENFELELPFVRGQEL